MATVNATEFGGRYILNKLKKFLDRNAVVQYPSGDTKLIDRSLDFHIQKST